MGYLFVGSIKYVTQVILKLFFVVIFAVVIMALGTSLLDADFNYLAEDVNMVEVAKSYFQHLPRIGDMADGILSMFDSVSVPFESVGVTLYEEILFCCVYLLIVEIFDFAIWIADGLCGLFMKLGKFITILVNISVCAGAYGLAALMAESVFDGILSKVSVEIACLVIAILVIAIPVLLLILGKNGVLGVVLKTITKIVMNVFQMVLIYIMMICIMLLSMAEATYMTGGETAMIMTVMVASGLMVAVLFIKELVTKSK